MRLASVAVLLALATSAGAAPPGLTAPVGAEDPDPEALPVDYTASYRAQTLGLDAAAVGLVLVGAVSGSNGHSSASTSMLELALATYLVGPPMAHLLHDRPGRAAASLALRVGAPLVLGLIGAQLGNSADRCVTDYCDQPGLWGAILGGMVGLIAAPIIDAAVFARGDPLPASTHLSVTAARDGGMTFGLAGSF